MQCSKWKGYSITSSAPREQRGWHGETEGLGSLEVDHKLMLGCRLYRQIRRHP
jgi:hypothetical protein